MKLVSLDIQQIREYYEKLCGKKLDNLKKWAKF